MENQKTNQKENEEETIAKRVAALEVYKVAQLARRLCLGMIISVFLTAIGAVISLWALGVVATIAVIVAAWYYNLMRQKMIHLENKYNITPAPAIKLQDE